MAGKTDFTPDEWKLVLESPMVASIAITAAAPSGLFGIVKEAFASGRALAEAKSDPGANELTKAVVADYETSEGRTIARDGLQATLSDSKAGEVNAKAVAALKQVAALLDAKAPGDATAYKTWLRHVSQAVAESATEGGFLGFGGVKVSEAEKATLDEISQVLGLPA